jgi:hypothetical protein
LTKQTARDRQVLTGDVLQFMLEWQNKHFEGTVARFTSLYAPTVDMDIGVGVITTEAVLEDQALAQEEQRRRAKRNIRTITNRHQHHARRRSHQLQRANTMTVEYTMTWTTTSEDGLSREYALLFQEWMANRLNRVLFARQLQAGGILADAASPVSIVTTPVHTVSPATFLPSSAVLLITGAPSTSFAPSATPVEEDVDVDVDVDVEVEEQLTKQMQTARYRQVLTGDLIQLMIEWQIQHFEVTVAIFTSMYAPTVDMDIGVGVFTTEAVLEDQVMIFIEQDLIPKKDRGAYNHV